MPLSIVPRPSASPPLTPTQLLSATDHIVDSVAPQDVMAAQLALHLQRSHCLGPLTAVQMQQEIQRLSPASQTRFLQLCVNGQVFDAEGACTQLSGPSWLKLLMMGLFAAASAPQRAASFGALHQSVAVPAAESSYRLRLMERALRDCDAQTLLQGVGAGSHLGTWACVNDAHGVAQVHYTFSRLAHLVSALGVGFERAASAQGHAALKLSLDAFALRKDEFDRVGNEALYLNRMFNGLDDKTIMMEFVRPGNILEVGPAGCAVLKLLQPLCHASRIIGLDVSEVALAELARQKTAENLSYDLIRGDALDMRRVLDAHGIDGLDTVIFCSVLHEVFSYVEYDGKKFNLDAVREAMRQSVLSLRPGGALVIRDWAIPDEPAAPRHMVLKTASAQEFFAAFVAQFEGHRINWQPVDEPTGDTQVVALSAQDAMEFMYKLSWGPESFPYEVREQYGVLTQAQYIGMMRDVAEELGVSMELSFANTYLQAGYKTALADKIDLLHTDGSVAEWPPSKMLLVFNRRA